MSRSNSVISRLRSLSRKNNSNTPPLFAGADFGGGFGSGFGSGTGSSLGGSGSG